MAGASSGSAAMRSASQYSTALTSWLVVRSIALIASASASEKRSTSRRRNASASGPNGLSSAKPASERPMNHSTSTRTRQRIRPYSESSGRSASTLPA